MDKVKADDISNSQQQQCQPASLDPPIGERFRACKEFGFPICLQRSLDAIFQKHSSEIVSIARQRAASGSIAITSSKDIWQLYVEILASLAKTIGDSSLGVIESRALKEMELLKCAKCPLYGLESLRKDQKYFGQIT
jgi:hypothetical protein